MKLNQEELYAALGLAMEKIEAAGGSRELTDAVVIVGDIRQSIGNRWNRADEYAAQRVRDQIKMPPSPIEEARQLMQPVVKYVQAVKHGVPIGVVAQAVAVQKLLDEAAAG